MKIGKMGFKEEAESFAEIACTKGWQVLSIDLPEHGETLSWEYYEYAKAHPITRWRCQTDILYAGNDNMTERKTVDKFVEQFHTSLMVMENGEHWFHTPEQLAVLNQWAVEHI